MAGDMPRRGPGLSVRGLLPLLAACLLLGACADLRYYGQAVRGQGALVLGRQSIARLVRDPGTDPALAARLRAALAARRFASERLGLPRNRSYTYYVALDRPWVVWNVFAAPRYSVEAVPQCFPVAGCVAYRGWFRAAAAQADAERLRAAGDDVWIGGVAAYSTLGWFADPVLSSMLGEDDDALVGTIFHELAHQAVYVRGDTTFNESFASFVEREGLREWRQATARPVGQEARQAALERGFTALVLGLRERLRRLYASGADAETLAVGKADEIAAFRQRYADWRDREWPGERRFDAWVAAPINNAKLLPWGLYDGLEADFARLFAASGRRWPTFLARVKALAGLPAGARASALRDAGHGDETPQPEIGAE